MEDEVGANISQAELLKDQFLKFFSNNNILYKTRLALFRNFKKNQAHTGINSLNSFDRKLLKGNSITYQKCKLIHQNKRKENAGMPSTVH